MYVNDHIEQHPLLLKVNPQITAADLRIYFTGELYIQQGNI